MDEKESSHEHKDEHKEAPQHEHAHHPHGLKGRLSGIKRHHKYAVFAIAILLFGVASFSHYHDEKGGFFAGMQNFSADVPQENVSVQAGSAAGNKVALDFYVMSQCPYGTQVEDTIAPVLDALGSSVDFSLNFIAREASGGFSSLHGQNEVSGDIVQLCAAKYSPDRYMGMIVCQNKDAKSIPGNWEGCANDNGIDVEKVRACYEGQEGKALLSASIGKANAIGASASPTIQINGMPYKGARDSLSFKRALCADLAGNPACDGLPKCGSDADCSGQKGKIGKCVNPNGPDARCEYHDPVKVDLVVLNEKTCSSCDTSGILGTTKQLFPGVVISNVDVSSSEGKALIKELNISVVPAYVFGSELVTTEAWLANEQLHGAFERIGSRYKLLDSVTGASYFIDAKAREAYYSSIGVKLGDNRPQIDFYVMSFCPYGNTAEEAIEPVYQALKNNASFNPRYIISGNAGSFSSLHGAQELNQDVREMCVGKYMGIGDWFRFALAINRQCSAQNADSCWEGVAKSLGLDTGKIASCEKDEGSALASEQVRLDGLLGVSGSPSVFIDGQAYNGQRTANGYKAALCGAFEEAPAECAGIVPEPQQAQAPTGGCGA